MERLRPEETNTWRVLYIYLYKEKYCSQKNKKKKIIFLCVRIAQKGGKTFMGLMAKRVCAT